MHNRLLLLYSLVVTFWASGVQAQSIAGPAELRPDLTTFNLSSRRGVPVSKQCVCPLDGVPATTGNALRGRRCLSVRPASIENLCLQRKSGDRCSVMREGGSCV